MAGKISLVLNIILAAAVIYLFTQLGNGKEGVVDKETQISETVEESTYPSIAIVDNDSLSMNYQFSLDKSEVLKKANEEIQNLESKMLRDQKAYTDIMNKAQTGGFTSDTEIASAEKKIKKIKKNSLSYQTQMETKLKNLNKLEREISDSLYSRIYKYIDSYTSDKPIDVIFLYSKGMTGLYSNGALDVTNEVVSGLNAAYEADVKK